MALSTTDPAVEQMSAGEFRQQLMNLLETVNAGSPFVVTANAKVFVTALASSIYKATVGKRNGVNRGNNFVLQGRKGVGKTMLFSALAAALTACKRNAWEVVVLRVDMNVVAEQCLAASAQADSYDHPIKQLALCVGFGLQNEAVTSANFDRTLGDVVRHMARRKVHVVMLLDDYQASYAEPHPHLLEWRRLCYRVPDFSQITAVVTGCGVHLGSLVFGRATAPSVKFPGYTSKAMNLNFERYLTYTLDLLEPVDGQADPMAFMLTAWKGLGGQELTEAEAHLVFFATAANLGQLARLASEEDPFATLSSLNSGLDHGELKARSCDFWLLATETSLVTRAPRARAIGAKEELLRMVAMVPLRLVDPKQTLSATVLDSAAEAGVIRYDERGGRVGFTTPLVAASIFQQYSLHALPEWFDLQLRLSLRYMYATLRVQAERAVCLVVADRHHLSGGVKALQRQDGSGSGCLLKLLPTLSLDAACEHVFHELPDRFGCTAMWLVLDEGTLIVHRCRIKLGTSRMASDEALAAIDQLSQRAVPEDTWLEHFEGAPCVSRVQVKLLLYCTRPFEHEVAVRERAQAVGVDIMDRQSLIAGFWPASLLEWSKRCGACLHNQ